ncbi:hypothetical protein HHK36_006621 [Tetracentron sinense]|uniref:Alpha 1,4-glycosyltransferase domain-containing protein n=1 Tax=Tetracentron sinense TaxID=13715 RepID=A0A834ZJC2_TETSI|nr:hypothetical protein HHK36_006621 [Tetracentron sinense]
MLRTLRTRRRPRYGAHLCAIFAALLLLLSVSVLHSRLGFDRISQAQPFSSSRLGLGFQSLPNLEFSDDSTDDPLLQDVVNGGSGNGDDDRIDELDVVEEETEDQARVSDGEEILRGVELDEESEFEGVDGNINRRSGYFFDHVVGVTRRAFDKRSIDQWDEYSSFDLSSKSEDQSKIAFGSDDQPVDEEIRRKLDEIRGIEDALLLKTSRSVSPLREGWATWFEKKGDFLRRDRMFKSNLEFLNPLNNPLLQDPDGVGFTVLTRGDKLVKKGLWDELMKQPFVVKKPLGITENRHEPKLVGDGNVVAIKKRGEVKDEEKVVEGDWEGRKTEVKRLERRTLDDTGSDSFDGKKGFNTSESLNLTEKADVVNGNGNSPTDFVMEQRIPPYKSVRKEGVIRESNVNGIDKVVDSSMGEVGQQSGLKNLDSEAQIKSELSSHIFADGKRWGYFPGLHPHLSFSNFMDAFFRKGKCLLRVFMVWNSPPWMYNVRHQRGLESLLFHHPDVCVVVFSETIELDFFKDFVKDGPLEPFEVKPRQWVKTMEPHRKVIWPTSKTITAREYHAFLKAHRQGNEVVIWPTPKRIMAREYRAFLKARRQGNEVEEEPQEEVGDNLAMLAEYNFPVRLYRLYPLLGFTSEGSRGLDICRAVPSYEAVIFKIAVAMPNLDELLMNMPTHIFASVWFEWRKTNFYPIHYSELVRLAALYKYGGLYLDSDIIVLKPLSSLNNSVGVEDQIAGSSFNGAVMAFKKNSPFIMECLKEFYSTYDDTRLRWNGADLLTRVGTKYLIERKNSDIQMELKMEQPFIFFPLSPQNITRYFTAPADEMERAEEDDLFIKILNNSVTFHFWNGLTSALVPEPESLVARLLNHYCIRCFDVL